MERIKNVTLWLLLILIGISCQDRETREVEDEEVIQEDTWNADEAMTQWRDAWNQNDAQALQSVTADDAVLLLNGRVHREDSVTNWMENSSSWMKDLNTSSAMKNKGVDLAYEAGSYTHRTTENDTLEMRGTYTVIWERNGNENEWEIKLMDISPDMQMDTIANEP